MMPARRLLLLIIAGIVALGTIFMARSMMTQPEAVVAAPQVQTTEVLVASHGHADRYDPQGKRF